MVAVPYYEFLIRDERDADLGVLEAETGLRYTPLDRSARLDGELIDRAALHGAITRVLDLGIDLRGVQRLPTASHTVAAP